MSKKIEAGIRVEVVQGSDGYTHWPCGPLKGTPIPFGYRGKVLSKCRVYDDHWDIEGLHEGLCSLRSDYLEPINPDATPADEEFTGDWQDWADRLKQPERQKID